MRAARARSCLALLALSVVAGAAVPSCWRAEHVWPLDPESPTTDTVGGSTGQVQGVLQAGPSGAPFGMPSTMFNRSGYIQVDAPFTFGGNFTITAWAQPSASNGGVFFSVYSGAIASILSLFTFGPSGAVSIVGTGSALTCSAANGCASCTGGPCWGHFALTMDTVGNAAMYYNGTVQNTVVNQPGNNGGKVNPQARFTNFISVGIGFAYNSQWTSSDSYFNGAIANLQIIPVVLDASDIASLAAGGGCAGAPPSPPLSPPPRLPPLPPSPPPPPPPSPQAQSPYGTALPSCWRAEHVWPLNPSSVTTDTVGLIAASVNGPAPQAGPSNGAPAGMGSLMFGGSTSIALSGSLMFGGNYTIAVWGRPSGMNNGAFFSAKGAQSASTTFVFSPKGATHYVNTDSTVGCPGGGCCLCSTATCASDCWGHYALSVDVAGNVRWYYNGVLQSTVVTFGGATNPASSRLYSLPRQAFSTVAIGIDLTANVYYNGAMAGLQIIPAVLSAADVASIAAGGGCTGSAPPPPRPPRPPPPQPPPPRSPPPPSPAPPPSPPLNPANIQAQLNALAALVPPTCAGNAFLQRTVTGWACVTPVQNMSAAAGFCRAAAGGGVACDGAPTAAPPSCLPPGGAWLGYSASAGGWSCVCAPGWSGPSCTTAAAPSAGVSCGAPPTCATGLYTYANGSFTCMPLACAPTPDRVAACAALGAFYTATNGSISRTTNIYNLPGTSAAAWANAAAGVATDYCSFAGVRCRSGSADIIGLYVYGGDVSGTIPPQIGALTTLNALMVSTSFVSGTIPPQLGSLTALTLLSLDSNKLTGTIPASLGSLTQLTNFAVAGNQLCGAFPAPLATLCAQAATCPVVNGGVYPLPPCGAGSPLPPLPPVASSPGGVLPPTGPSSSLVNVALGGVASLSTTLNQNNLFQASNANDGFTVCSDTEAPTLARADYQQPTWWSVDLQSTYNVQWITVFGRDCCVSQSGSPTNTVQSDQLNVYVGNSSTVSGSSLICASNVTAPAAGVNVSCAGGVYGRYVFIVKLGGTGYGGSFGDYMSLCEVQVWAVPAAASPPPPPPPPSAQPRTNLALMRSASQSSTYSDSNGDWDAAHGNDGNTVCAGGAGTGKLWAGMGTPSWWMVDLGSAVQVATVTIYGRDCCQPLTTGNVIQSNHLEIRVGNTSAAGGQANTLCASEIAAPAAGVNVSCSGIAGRFVSVLKTGVDGPYADYLSLCEVEVYGS